VEMLLQEFEAVLLRLTSLTRLTFGAGGGICNEHLGLLTSTESGSLDLKFVVVPKLQSLSLLEPVLGVKSSYTEDMLLDLREARWRSTDTASRLISVKLELNLADGQSQVRLEQLRIEGLRVTELHMEE
ncbi:hypothetical protein V5O48_013578, partial [Marasmius crinis-equi]